MARKTKRNQGHTQPKRPGPFLRLARASGRKFLELRERAGYGKAVHYYDYNLLAAVIILVAYGLIMLYSTSAYESFREFESNDMYYFARQAVISAASILGAMFVSLFNYRFYMRYSGYLYLICLVLMAMVKWSPLGVSAYGARRWLQLGIRFQPSEIAKVALILFLPYMILRIGRNIKSWRGGFFILTLGLIPAAAAWYCTDHLSAGIILACITCVYILLADPKSGKWLVLGLVATVILAAILFWLKGHLYVLEEASGEFRLKRIYEWLSGGSYQILQSLYAIGSGGFFGKGLGNSTQKLGTIPEAQNDMIFPIICEELGMFGALLLLLMFGYLLYRLFFIAQNAPDLYGSMVVSGIFVHIALQVILNLCVALNLMPPTGITLPFVSYGGTSVVFLMTEIGIALGVSRQIILRDEESTKNLLTNS